MNNFNVITVDNGVVIFLHNKEQLESVLEFDDNGEPCFVYKNIVYHLPELVIKNRCIPTPPKDASAITSQDLADLGFSIMGRDLPALNKKRTPKFYSEVWHFNEGEVIVYMNGSAGGNKVQVIGKSLSGDFFDVSLDRLKGILYYSYLPDTDKAIVRNIYQPCEI